MSKPTDASVSSVKDLSYGLQGDALMEAARKHDSGGAGDQKSRFCPCIAGFSRVPTNRGRSSDVRSTISRQFHNDRRECDLLVLQVGDQFPILCLTACQLCRIFASVLFPIPLNSVFTTGQACRPRPQLLMRLLGRANEAMSHENTGKHGLKRQFGHGHSLR